MARALVRFGLLATGLFAALAACGGDAGEPTSDPVTAPSVLRLVATPSVGSVDSGGRVEAVVAYPERVTGSAWTACLLLVDDPAATDCPLPEVQLYGYGLFRANIDYWALQNVGNQGAPLFEALSQVNAAHPEQLPACVAAVTAQWDACAAGGWADQCAWQHAESLAACIRAGGVDVRVRFAATLDDGNTLEATRRIPFLKSGSPAVGNRNPVLFNLQVDGRQVLSDQIIQVPVGTTLLLAPTPFEQSAETYVDAVTGQTLTEQLTFTWVRTGGDLDTDHTPFGDALNTLYVPQSALGTPLTLWVFFEDNRGGVDWTRVGIDPVPTP